MLMIPFPKDFQDFLRLLGQHNVKYVVVGGYALGYHGYVRATGDLDLFIEISESNEIDWPVPVIVSYGIPSSWQKVVNGRTLCPVSSSPKSFSPR